MFQLAAHTPTVAQADGADGATKFFLLLAAGAFVFVVLRLVNAGELGNVITTVGSVITAVVVVIVLALILYVVLVALHALLAF